MTGRPQPDIYLTTTHQGGLITLEIDIQPLLGSDGARGGGRSRMSESDERAVEAIKDEIANTNRPRQEHRLVRTVTTKLDQMFG